MRMLSVFLGAVFCSIILCHTILAQTLLDQPLSGGFFGLDNQSLQGESRVYTIILPENASYLFVGVLAREGVVDLEVKNSSNYVYPYSAGSSVIENAESGIYTLTVSGSGKYVVFWDYVSVPMQPQKGPWYDIMQSAYKCDQPIEIHNRFTEEWESSGMGIGYAYYAYTPGDLRPVPPTLNNGQTVYFLIDLDSFGESIGYDLSGKNIRLIISDKNYKQVEYFFEFELITIDKYGNEVEAPKYAFMSAGNGLAQGLWTIYKHKKGNLYLYRITSHSPYSARFDFFWGAEG
jgi:hypothetical protein